MTEPHCPQARPYVLQEAAGAVRSWCACGLSQAQPFCDGSHGYTGLEPVVHVVTAAGPVAWCGCKRTKTPPLCDGSHATVRG